jgi:hypothetical protein
MGGGQQQQYSGGGQSAVGAEAGAAAGGTVFSDERKKEKIEPLDPELLKKYPGRDVVPLGSPQMEDYGGVREGTDMGLLPIQYSSWNHTPIRPGVDLRAAKGYAYDYKDPSAPGAAPGRHVGPMAQDLKNTAAQNTVLTDPQTGMLSVDTGRLALVNTAALAEQQKRMDRMEAIAKIRPEPAPEPLPAPLPAQKFAPMDTSALDAAYEKEKQDTGARY